MIRGIPFETDHSKVFHAGTILDESQQVLSNGGRVLCVVALGNDVKQAQDEAYLLVKQIQWPGAYYRNDIGFKALR